MIASILTERQEELRGRAGPAVPGGGCGGLTTSREALKRLTRELAGLRGGIERL